MKENILIPLNIEEKEVMINPIIDPSTILEKIERKVVYIPYYRRYHEVVPKVYTLPVYLPEIGALVSLDITSRNLAKKFYDETKDFEGMISKGKIFISGVYNFLSETNRMVSWGNIKSFSLPKDIFQLYLTNLLNDLIISPSIVTQQGVISPNRWFHIVSKGYYTFRATLHYNIGVIYLQKESLLRKRIRYVWINAPLKLYEIKAGFVIFQPNGYLKYVEPILVHFTSDPSENIIASNKGDYFLCFLISFNKYSTSYEKADIKRGYINIIETLSELVFSPYDLLPFLFPLVIDVQKLTSLLFEFQIEKNIFLTFQKRLTKFGIPQNLEVIKAYENLVKKQNRTLEIIETENAYTVKIINPLLVPFLIKKAYDPKDRGKNYAEKLLRNLTFSKIEELDKRFPEKFEWYTPNFRGLWGIGRFLDPRGKLMRNYVNIFRRYYKT